MGSLILCHKKKAKHPYEISRIHMRIYTIEELCYYFCNNLYLVDYTIINRQLCDWLDEELELYSLADELRAIYADQLGLSPSDDVVAYCRIGERSSHTWFVLHHLLGYPQVRNYDGSWTEW